MEAMLIDSPAKLLVSYFSESNDSRKIYLVSGISGVGKTLWCMKLFYEARSMNLDVKGVVSIPVFEEETKTGINLQDLESGLFKPLGYKSKINENSIPVGEWQLDEETIQWGNDILEKIRSCQILIIDELGPLEFIEKGGLSKSFDTLETCQFNLAFVVVRPSLIPQAQTKWPSAEVLYVPESELSA